MTLSGSLDAPEATLDALIQSVVCRDVSCSLIKTCEESLISQEVGWRNGSLRIVMIFTDAGFKTALDGKVGSGYVSLPLTTTNFLQHHSLSLSLSLSHMGGRPAICAYWADYAPDTHSAMMARYL